MEASIFLGIFLHAIGGIAAATCFVPQKGSPKWSFQTYFLLMSTVSWLIAPIIGAMITVPELGAVIAETPGSVLVKTTLLGCFYGFGGMAFGVAIQYVGYSLTYAIAIGISAVVGTLMPQLLAGTVIQDYSKPGGLVVLAGFVVSVIGVACCGRAGFLKEGELSGATEGGHTFRTFNMGKGLLLAAGAGILSGVFGLALAQGAPMDAIAAEHGAGHFQGNAKFIFAMGGAFITNLIWWGVVHLKEGTFSEYLRKPEGGGNLAVYWLMGIVGGILWYVQFLFYGLGHVRMGDYGFISWGVHMAMLIFFSFGIGLAVKEWKGANRKTLSVLIAGLLTLVIAFGLVTLGSWQGQRAASEATPTTQSGH